MSPEDKVLAEVSAYFDAEEELITENVKDSCSLCKAKSLEFTLLPLNHHGIL